MADESADRRAAMCSELAVLCTSRVRVEKKLIARTYLACDPLTMGVRSDAEAHLDLYHGTSYREAPTGRMGR